ncbi:MAG: PaaI family thioesterase [Armatimonadota bacterium]|nr:PaaI family thioesterase [Armatimonadota bacterium]MDR7452381.1 PaaI family thioesterase [Armatimonadota bacterium]MDR7466726.1 PaaI family thioesterase [Armatimonadota bacterium]MDR7492800.1 PaaI family thioesterase [Armatimonadota bacterium]MDR7498576.1 PaaI family thioesterase [Armatimonadota bacterium]
MRDASRCFVCGPDNPIGLKLRFTRLGEGVRAEFTPSDLHVGYEGLVHGGIIAALIDDALANIWFARGQEALTAKIEVRFRREVRPGERLVVTAHPTGSKAGLATARAEVVRTDGDVVAEGTGLLAVKRDRSAG